MCFYSLCEERKESIWHICNNTKCSLCACVTGLISSRHSVQTMITHLSYDLFLVLVKCLIFSFVPGLTSQCTAHSSAFKGQCFTQMSSDKETPFETLYTEIIFVTFTWLFMYNNKGWGGSTSFWAQYNRPRP